MGKPVIIASLIGLVGFLIAIGAVLTASTASSQANSIQDVDWRSDWAVQRGFDVTIDSQGFRLPTAIAFVPNPGPSPDDPLYFVTELEGTVRVVTNDRSVLTFAENIARSTGGPDSGLAGICLDPNHGYVFVTFAFRDSEDNLRNNIVRFKSNPETFSLTPTSLVDFAEIFASFRSSGEHQIGGCQVKDDLLFVGVGDGSQTKQSQQIESVLGKVLRMTLDGEPALGNPFHTGVGAQDDGLPSTASYVWAYGLRNPFGLKIVGDQVFVADNGPSVDRFLRVEEGINYLWDGSDNSIGTNSDAVLIPGKGVAQMDYYPLGQDFFPSRFRDSFYLTLTGSFTQQPEGIPAIQALAYDFNQERLLKVASPLLRYRGNQIQLIAGLAFGKDGLYFAPMLPNESGVTAVLKVGYEPDAGYPFLLDEETNPVVLMNDRGCFACHTLNSNSGGNVGPVLDRDMLVPRILERLNSEEYRVKIGLLDLSEEEPFLSYREARRSIAAAQDLEKVNLWLESRIQEPRFDNPDAKMPSLGLSQQQASSIAAFLSGTSRLKDERPASETEGSKSSRGFFGRISNSIRGWFPTPTRENARNYVLASFGGGLILGGLALAASSRLLVWIKRWRQARPI